MVRKVFTLQFAKDGLIGIVVALVILICLIALAGGTLAIFGALDSFVDFVSDFPAEFLINPLPFIIFVTFVGAGVGGLLLENASTQNDWVKAILLTLLVICVFDVFMAIPFIAIGMSIKNPLELLGGLLIGGLFSVQIICPGGVCLSVFGFVPLWAIATITKPEKRIYKVTIGALASSMLGIGMSCLIFIMQLFFA